MGHNWLQLALMKASREAEAARAARWIQRAPRELSVIYLTGLVKRCLERAVLRRRLGRNWADARED